MREQAHLLPDERLRDEIRSIVASDSSLPGLLVPQRDEPDLPNYRLLLRGQSPFYIVKVPIPGKSGIIWASRLPGIRPTFTDEEVSAVKEFGIGRVVCLVPTISLENLHGAYRYLDSVRSAFPDAFHQLEIVDHEIPADDTEFQRTVGVIDAALRRGEHVLVHCVGGCGRTGMFVSCLLVRAGLEAKDAIRTLPPEAEVRPGDARAARLRRPLRSNLRINERAFRVASLSSAAGKLQDRTIRGEVAHRKRWVGLGLQRQAPSAQRRTTPRRGESPARAHE